MSKRTGRWYSGLEWGWGGVGGGNRASSPESDSQASLCGFTKGWLPPYTYGGGLEGEEGFLANTKYRETTVPPLHTLPPWKKSKKGGSLWQDTHREQQRVCFFYLFLSLKEVKRRPGVNSSIPGWWWAPPPRGCWAPELSGGVLCHSQNNQKKNQSWEAWSLFTWMCFVCCAVVNTRSQLVHFIFQDRATLSPLSFYTAPCPSPTCAFSCRAL